MFGWHYVAWGVERMSVSLLHRRIDDKLVGFGVPETDISFEPVWAGDKRYLAAAESEGEAVQFALLRDNGNVARFVTKVLAPSHPNGYETHEFLTDLVAKHLVFFGAHTLQWCGPNYVSQMLEDAFLRQDGFYSWIGNKLLPKTYDVNQLSITNVTCEALSSESNRSEQICGSSLASGTYLGVDIGRSNIRTVVVRDREVIYAEEAMWTPDHPSQAPNEFNKLPLEISRAIAAAGGSVDGIVGGSAGVFINSRMKIGNLVGSAGGLFNKILEDVDVQYCKTRPALWLHDGTMQAITGQVLGLSGPVLGIALGNDKGAGLVYADGNPFSGLSESAFYRANRFAMGFSTGKEQPPGSAGSIFSHKGPNYLYHKIGGKWHELGVPENAHPRVKFLAISSMLNGPYDKSVRDIAYTIGAELAHHLPSELEMCPHGTKVFLGGKVMEGEFGGLIHKAAVDNWTKGYSKHFKDSQIVYPEHPAFGELIDRSNPGLRQAFESRGKSLSEFSQAYGAAILAARIAAR